MPAAAAVVVLEGKGAEKEKGGGEGGCACACACAWLDLSCVLRRQVLIVVTVVVTPCRRSVVCCYGRVWVGLVTALPARPSAFKRAHTKHSTCSLSRGVSLAGRANMHVLSHRT